MKIAQTLLVPYAATDMFDLIDDVEHYPEFLPWCPSSALIERTETLTVGTIHVSWLGARFAFTTRNPKQRPEWMQITLQSGPFKELQGEWRFQPLGDTGCKVSLTLDYRFDNALVGMIATPVFARIANTLADAFVARARVLAASGQLHRPPMHALATSPSSTPKETDHD